MAGPIALCFDGGRDGSRFDHPEQRLFDRVIDPQAAESDATWLAIVEQPSPAGVARDVMVGPCVSDRQLPAASFAAEKTGKQKLLTSLVLAGSSARNEPADQLQSFREWVNSARTGGFVGETLDFTMRIMFGETTRNNPAKAEMLALWRARISELPLSLHPAMSGVIERTDARPYLPLIKSPVLVISGEEDMPRPPAWAKEVVDGLPNAELLYLERIGHSPTLEASDEVMPRTLEFFDRHSG